MSKQSEVIDDYTKEKISEHFGESYSPMKSIPLIDESKIFAVNEELNIQKVKVGKYDVIIVDDFYKNPESVRQLALMTPSSEQSMYRFHAIGRKIYAGYDLSSLAFIFHKISKMSFSFAKDYALEDFETAFKEMHFTCNVSKWSDYESQSSNIAGRIPHTDGARPAEFGSSFKPGKSCIASLITLNTPPECEGGTGFWEYDGIQAPPNDMPAIKDDVPFVNKDVGPWKLLDIVPMKFNRLILYPIYMFHHPYIDENMKFDGKPTYRINQVMMA